MDQHEQDLVFVKPTRDNVAPHPQSGALDKAGGYWPNDQFTFRRIRDGDIERAKPPADAKTKPATAEAGSQFAHESPAATAPPQSPPVPPKASASDPKFRNK